MKVIKRNGSEVSFDIAKIIAAITKANESVDEAIRMTPMQIQRIAESVEFSCLKMNRSPSVEEIQDLVEYQIMAHGAFEVAKNYVTYRYTRSLVRRSNTTDEKILSLIECCNEEAKQENANKNPVVNSVQRDYMAGEVSKDITQRLLLPPDIVEAHKAGIIHFHDMDYYAQHMHNCDLVNLEDMLQNGTVISGTLIEKPHSFSTACNIATQIIAQVASNQYGGQSISLAHLAPFVQVSREKIRGQVLAEIAAVGGSFMAPSAMVDAQDWAGITALCKKAVDKSLGFTLAHVGINGESKDEGLGAAEWFNRCFGWPVKEGGRSNFAATYVECCNQRFPGRFGHIGVFTLSMRRALAYFRAHGIATREEFKNVNAKGELVAVYLEEEVGGFAVHIVKKS